MRWKKGKICARKYLETVYWKNLWQNQSQLWVNPLILKKRSFICCRLGEPGWFCASWLYAHWKWIFFLQQIYKTYCSQKTSDYLFLFIRESAFNRVMYWIEQSIIFPLVSKIEAWEISDTWKLKVDILIEVN